MSEYYARAACTGNSHLTQSKRANEDMDEEADDASAPRRPGRLIPTRTDMDLKLELPGRAIAQSWLRSKRGARPARAQDPNQFRRGNLNAPPALAKPLATKAVAQFEGAIPSMGTREPGRGRHVFFLPAMGLLVLQSTRPLRSRGRAAAQCSHCTNGRPRECNGGRDES